MENQTSPHPLVAESKQFRKDLDGILQRLKNSERKSRSRSLAITHLEDSILRLGMDLKEMREEGLDGCENPYPQSYNPQSPVIEPTADNLKL